MATLLAPTWEEIAADPRFLEGDLEIGHDADNMWRDGRFKLRGPIKSITILEADTEEGGRARVELEWVACRRDDNDDWVWAPTLSTDREITWHKWSTLTIDESGRFCFSYQERGQTTPAFIYPSDLGKLDSAGVMTEYHIATHVRHSLYPPSPFDDLEHVGVTWGAGRCEETPEEGQVIAFVVHSFSLEAAETWCRGECARWNLPIIGMKQTQLLPGY